MCAMHWITCLKCDDLAPAEFLEAVSNFTRRIPQILVVVVRRLFEAAQFAANVNRIANILKVIHGRMCFVRSPVNAFGLRIEIGCPQVANLERRKNDAFEIAQCQLVTWFDVRRKLFGYIEHDRNRPQHAALEAHLIDDRIVVIFVEKPVQWRKCTV